MENGPYHGKRCPSLSLYIYDDIDILWIPNIFECVCFYTQVIPRNGLDADYLFS